MSLPKGGFRIAALVLLAGLLATNVYRAATQSIAHDEALTWQVYLSGPASTMFHYYDANNHFLATVLFRISTTLFGNSELAMRLPTLLAGAWFFWTVFRLCALVLGDGWLFLVGCAALTLNPILLDFLVAARGYGLAIAGLFWALYQMLTWFNERGTVPDVQLRKRLWKAAFGCSIAVAANLTLLMPAFVVAVAFCIMLRAAGKPTGVPAPASAGSAKTRKKSKKSKPEALREPARSYAPLLNFIVPTAACAVLFLLAAPIDLARSQDFYVGMPSAIKSWRNLMEVSFAYAGSGVLGPMERISRNIALVLVPALVLAALAVAFTAVKEPSLVQLATLLSSLAVAGSAVLLALAHVMSGLPFPQDRTGLYFVPLATLAALGLARMLTGRSGYQQWLGIAAGAVLACCAIEFALQWNVRSFWVWRYDADTKRIFEALEAAPKPPGPIHLGVSWVLEPALNYYREVRKAAWLLPVERDGFDGSRQFYVAIREDQRTRRWRKSKVIYQGPVSGTALAIPPRTP
ncbi:MAG TPA: hypothetical protein VME17_20725 [Bryobacteraceae bacterium]|nr:hypothetical protein [Bryobacteraceae bacterium]